MFKNMHEAKKDALYITFLIVILIFLVKVTAIDLSNFPDQFKEKDVKIVVGNDADRSDMLGAIKIAENIKAEGNVVVSKSANKFQIGGEKDLLELGESFSDVTESITEKDLSGFKGGSLTTEQGTTDYNQYLRLLSGNVSLTKGDTDTTTFLKFEKGEEVFEYEL